MTKSIPISCPNGESNCPIFSEIAELRDKVIELKTQVRTDFLTGLFNKQHLLFSLEQEIERTQRTLQPTTLILIDADHFKSVNDTHGHVVGDRVIEHLGRIIKETIRKIDIACRYGGEEFAIILPSTGALIGAQVAERLREKVQNAYLTLENGETLSITISLGVDTCLHTNNVSVASFIKQADDQLYQAKELGRNTFRQATQKTDDKTTVTSEEKDALFNVHEKT